MHAKSGLRVLLEWKINRPDSVITAVIMLRNIQPNAIRDRCCAIDRVYVPRFRY